MRLLVPFARARAVALRALASRGALIRCAGIGCTTIGYAVVVCGSPLRLVSAQSPVSGGAQRVLFAAESNAGGGPASGSLYALQGALGGSAAFESAVGASSSIACGPLASGASLAPAAPILFSVHPPLGARSGGDEVLVLGFGFLAPEPAELELRFGAALASELALRGNTQLEATTPPGSNEYGNPLGPVPVELGSGLAPAALVGGFAYGPALLLDLPAQLGSTCVLRFEGPPGGFGMLAIGYALPDFALPLPPLEGAIEIIDYLSVLTSVLAAPSGTLRFEFAVPADPQLLGQHYEFQMASLTGFAPLTGGFTNRLRVDVER
jgi:hypothetical protein